MRYLHLGNSTVITLSCRPTHALAQPHRFDNESKALISIFGPVARSVTILPVSKLLDLGDFYTKAWLLLCGQKERVFIAGTLLPPLDSTST